MGTNRTGLPMILAAQVVRSCEVLDEVCSINIDHQQLAEHV